MATNINVFPTHLIKKCINILLSENSVINVTDIKNINTIFSMRQWKPDANYLELPIKLYEDVFTELIRLRNSKIISTDILKASIESKFNQPNVLAPEYYTRLETIIFSEISSSEVEEVREIVSTNISRGVTFRSVPLIEELLGRMEVAPLEELDNLINDFKNTLANVATDIAAVKKPTNKLENIILTKNNIADLATHIHAELNRKNRRLKTGIKAFDHILEGGFSPGTANLIGASTGNGKSLTLLNLTESLAVTNKASEYQTSDPTKKPLIVYISFENVQQMTFLRLCKLITNKGQDEVKITEPAVINDEIAEHLDDAIDIKLVYAPSFSITVQDLDRFCLGNVDEDGNEYETIAVVVDYLALFTAPSNAENHRLGLSMTQRALADYATVNNLIEISAVQLNTESDIAPKLTRAAIGESRAILDHVDNAVLFRKHSFTPGQDSLGESFSYDDIEDPNKITFLEAYSIKSRSAESNPEQRIIMPFDRKNGFKIARTGEKNFIDDKTVTQTVIDDFLNNKFNIKTSKVQNNDGDGLSNVPDAILPKIDGGGNPYGS